MVLKRIALVRNIKVALTFEKSYVFDGIAIEKAVKIAVKSKYKSAINLKKAFVYKKSIDARDKNKIFFIYTVAFPLNDDINAACDNREKVDFATIEQPDFICNKKLSSPPVVVGFGPAGMFCALALAKAGLEPIVIERGDDVDSRTKKVEQYWKSGILDSETNVQFGEGGAGTFSDGKLLTRISDKLCSYVLDQFVLHGAPKEILYLAKPHIGTDNLRNVVKSIRNEIVSLGGKVLFNTKLTGVEKDSSGVVKSISVNSGDSIKCSALFLCIGHSARDTVMKLKSSGTLIEPKPFSVGVRIEHLQKDIDNALYGKFAACESLGRASYTLSKRFDNRTVYSFCMCPGGIVVASASEDGQIVTNGMSYFARDGINANSAIAVSVDTDDYGKTVEGAIDFQERIERRAFEIAGADGTAPIQLLGDFFDAKSLNDPSRILPTYTGKTAPRRAQDVFPEFICRNLADGIRCFDREIEGFACCDAVLTFPETRTSSPVKIPRNNELVATGYTNLYPCGEGAGYAGGITSAAVDGLRAALGFLKE